MMEQIEWEDHQFVYNGRIHCRVQDASDVQCIELWVLNGQWKGYYDSVNHTLLIPQIDEVFSNVDPFTIVGKDDNPTGYGDAYYPMTKKDFEILRENNPSHIDGVCQGCFNFMGPCDGGWICPGAY